MIIYTCPKCYGSEVMIEQSVVYYLNAPESNRQESDPHDESFVFCMKCSWNGELQHLIQREKL